MTERINVFHDLIWASSPTHAAPMKGEAQEGHNKHLPGPALSFRFCVGCKRLLHPWELFADGWRDTTMWCHACLRNAHMAGYYAADGTAEYHEPRPEDCR